MDLLEYLPEYRILCCKACKIGLVPKHYARHLHQFHSRTSPELESLRTTRLFVSDVLLPSLQTPPLQPQSEPVNFPGPHTTAFPALKVFKGLGCSYCSFVGPDRVTVSRHFNATHAAKRRSRGGPSPGARGKLKQRIDREHYGDQPPWSVAFYQRFFKGGRGSNCFRVAAPPEQQDDPRTCQHAQRRSADDLASSILAELGQLEEEQSQQGIVDSRLPARSQVSPWLERTRWTSYFDGVPFDHALRLGRAACRFDEPIIYELSSTIDRLVDVAYREVCEDKINFFGQKRIMSFIPGREVYSKPLVFKLQDGTYRQYNMVWKRALTFICRSVQKTREPRLSHFLNSEQTALLDSALALAAQRVARPHSATDSLDRKCLDLCVSLLDQRLTGNIFDSALIGFLAVLGIDESKDSFFEATQYTPKLSAFIKIAQLLVLHKSVVLVEEGLAPDPLQALDDMRLRFMTLNNPTPFSWALQLRAFGKRIRDNTTSLGHVRWSEDAHVLSYCHIEMPIDGFRDFVREQVYKAQQLLEQLLLVGVDEERKDVVPRVALSQLVDNPAIISPGWNFLQDPRNKKALDGGSVWLIKRVLADKRLREQFCTFEIDERVTWNVSKLNAYKQTVGRFLEVLLLLVHVTGGQPARGTEITNLMHTNTTYHRNIFIEEGLVAIVTSYHKGYTCTGSTKIIHRYLPSEVSELFVFYVWLVLPFVRKVGLLQRKKRCPPDALESQSPFLWPLSKEQPWLSARLSNILRQETQERFKAPLTIATYRHLAIAMSRRHITDGGFKRDYGVEENASDQQTAHSTWTAGRLYARGLEEAPGHVESRRAGFRHVSRQWHGFLGFSVPQIKRRLPFEDVTNLQPQKRQRRESHNNSKAQGDGTYVF